MQGLVAPFPRQPIDWTPVVNRHFKRLINGIRWKPRSKVRVSRAVGLVGTAPAVSQGVSGAAVTPSWGTGENRTAGNLLICMVTGMGATTLPPTPTGWQVLGSGNSFPAQTTSTTMSVTIFGKVATGTDAAPTIAATTSVTWTAMLLELTGADTTQLGGPSTDTSDNTGTASPIVANSSTPGDNNYNLAVGAALYSTAATKTLTHTFAGLIIENQADNNSTSTVQHYAHAWASSNGAGTTANGDSFSFTTTKITAAAVAFAAIPPAAATSQHWMPVLRVAIQAVQRAASWCLPT